MTPNPVADISPVGVLTVKPPASPTTAKSPQKPTTASPLTSDNVIIWSLSSPSNTLTMFVPSSGISGAVPPPDL